MPKLLFIPVGGLGGSQLRTTRFLWWKTLGIIDAVKSIPDVLVFENSGWEEYRGAGIWEFIEANPGVPVYLAGHSLGTDTVIAAAQALGSRCKGVTVCDPVNHPKPDPGCPALIYHAANEFPFAAKEVTGHLAVTIPSTDHNSCAHHPMVFDETCAAIRKAMA